MKKEIIYTLAFGVSILFNACNTSKTAQDTTQENISNEVIVDRFADIQVLRYDIVGFEKLSLNQKKLVYYMAQAGLSGRDIAYEQNNPYNVEIRKCLEVIVGNYQGDQENEDWEKFLTYAKRVWFSNGIHHHYGMEKIMPEISESYFKTLVKETNATISSEAIKVIFDKNTALKRKVKDANVDMIVASANGFYGKGVTQKMVETYYSKLIDDNDPTPIEYGLNSTLILKNGEVIEDTWKSGGRYGKSIDKIIFWLTKAVTVAENKDQANALKKLIEYYKTGDLKTWDEYNILWASSTKGDIDWINGFIETYGDALGKRGGYESIVEITDFEASKHMKVVAENAQWFEDNSTIMPEHKKKNVKGVSYKVVQVASESGDAAPATPIGVNLPNNNWIREKHGSKSVSLGNVIAAYEKAGGKGLVQEFAHDQEEIDRATKYSALASKLHTALHEVIGHASGQINKGVGQPSETLKNYASTLEEARADLVGLYYIMDQKLVDIGLIPSLEVGKAGYDNYIRNGMLTQLQRLELGKQVEEEHMQNRQLVASWVFEKGTKEKVIEKVVKNGKTYYDIKDYTKLRALFGELLKEIQRITSEGDYNAGKILVETYGVKVNKAIHAEVLKRVKPLNLAPYNGFVHPIYVPIRNNKGAIIDIKIENKQTFVEQMLYYGKEYSF
ncbi:MAG: dihydrofolate reductase [Flavobacteriia bacterium]|nr:dihydrofolate reductase [Flavobacteriia bacterium]